MIVDRLGRGWAALNPRERRWITAGGMLLLPAVIYFGWLEPLLKERTELEGRVHRVHKEAAALNAMRVEWESLRGQVAGKPAEPLESRLRASVTASGLSELTIRGLEGGAVLIEGRRVPVGKLARWMSEVRRETRSQWGDWSMERESEAGTVQFRIRFVELGAKAS